jgi:cholesterol transport system auxiliary component
MASFIRIRRHARYFLTGMFFLSLAACTIIPNSPLLQVYLLPDQPAAAPSGQKVNWSLRVVQPGTNQFLNSSRIAVQSQGEELAVYKDSRWSDPVPILLRNRLIMEFRRDGRVRAVTNDDDGLPADYELSGDLTAFQGVQYANKNEVLIRFDARLVRASERKIIASRSFEIRQPIGGSSMNDVVQAFGRASDNLSAQVLSWTLQAAAE